MSAGTYVESNGRIFATANIAGPKAPWLVFSNSLMTDHTVWDAQVSHFGGRFNILTYDQRGHGRSEAPGSVTFDVLSRDVLALLDHFDIARCTYVGLSMGVPTGLAVVARAPERIEGLLLSDGQMATQATGRATWQSRIDNARAHGMPWVADDTVGRWFNADFVKSGGATRLRDAAATMSVEGYCACAAALQVYDFTNVATGLSVPVQLVAGANDGAMPAVMQRMTEAIPGASLDVIPDAGHIPNLEQPARFNAVLESYLSTSKS
jgi:3-oxoadipate enol-lactonase